MSRFSYPNSHLTKRSLSKNIAVNLSITGLSDNDILKRLKDKLMKEYQEL